MAADPRIAQPPAAQGPFAEDVRRWREAMPDLPRPGAGDTLGRWRQLAAIAAHDVCVAKVLEAHHDALAIIDDLAGDPPAADGCLLAVWAAEPPDARVDYLPTSPRHGNLSGTKAWCSGADLVDEALVTAHRGDDRVLVRVALAQPGVSAVDGSWQAVGMSRVESGRVSFHAAQATLLGTPGAYLDRPGFWHGGAGIAACWHGAAAAIAGTLRSHPRVAGDPLMAAHLGAIDIALQASRALLRQLAARIDADPSTSHWIDVIRVRAVTERACVQVMDRLGRALGPAPLCIDAAHARRCADLAVFIRQSHADRDWADVGRATAGEEDPWTL